MSKLKELTLKLLQNEIFHFNDSDLTYAYFPKHINDLLSVYGTIINDKPFWVELYKNRYPDDSDLETGYTIFPRAIKELSTEIVNSIEFYYKGKVNQAYTSLENGLNEGIHFTNISQIFKEASKTYTPNELKLYRIRIRDKNNDEAFYRKEMFHIPFEKREYVSTQRFSIPGHPSLYLGDSIYICWEELNQPSVNTIYASKFTNAETLILIELIRTKDFLPRIDALDDRELSHSLLRFLLTFPLNIACCIRTKNRGAFFKPEYIIPQLFMQFVMENKEQIDGITYYSTIPNYDRIENIKTNNFVFPTRTLNDTGHCEVLKRKFQLTEPILWEFEQISRENRPSGAGPGPRRGINLELSKGRKTPYDWTAFSAIEGTLDYPGMTLGNIN